MRSETGSRAKMLGVCSSFSGKDPMKTRAGRLRIAERAVLYEQEIKERGGDLFDHIPECRDTETRNPPEIAEARERAAREAQRPRSLLETIRER